MKSRQVLCGGRAALVSSLGLMSLGLASCASNTPTALQSTAAKIRIEKLQTGSSASLRGLCVVSARVVFASGSDGTLLRSVDGGVRWERLDAPAGHDYRAVYAVDASRMLVAAAGQPAAVYRSTDAVSFERVFLDRAPAAFFDALAGRGRDAWLFGDPVGGRFSLFRVAALGASFVPQGQHLPAPRDGEAAFAASSSCAALADDDAVLLVTTGQSALPRLIRFDASRLVSHAVELPLASGGPGRGAFSVAASGDSVVVVGGDYLDPAERAGCAAFSTDGGRSFAQAAGMGGYRSCVAEVPGYPGWYVAVGPEGADFSSDSGRTWTELSGLRGHAIRFAEGGIGFASGAQGVVHRIVLPRF